MLNLKRIAITGGVATGKSTVCHILEGYGAFTLNSDAIVHQILTSDPLRIEQVISLLGSEVITDEKIDRKKVADVVFSDEKKLSALESLLHPPLFRRIDEEFKKVEAEGKNRYFVVELSLVQEIGKDKDFDLVIAVISSKDKAIERFTQKGFTKESFLKRTARQWDLEKKAKYADYVIENDGTVENLNQKILELMKEIDSQ